MSDFIPCEKIEKGLQIIKKNVKSLIETATLLNNNKKFLHSAMFSIFAIEEIAKALVLKANSNQNSNITYAEWNKIVMGKAHYEKWKIYLEALSSNTDDAKKHPLQDVINELIVNYHQRLKKNVLYVNWDRRLNQWDWIPDYYSEAEQERKSAELLNAASKGYETYLSDLM
jgi:AbiV family abortive infection protein